MKDIWGPRCEIIHNLEKSKNINKKFKNLNRLHNPHKSLIILDRNINIENSLESLRNKILFGGDVLDFTRHVNYVFAVISLTTFLFILIFMFGRLFGMTTCSKSLFNTKLICGLFPG